MSSASTLPPGPDRNLSHQYLIPVGILAIISLSLCTARIYTRSRPKFHLKADDYMILIAEICSFFGFITVIIAAAYGWGRLSYYVSPSHQIIALKAGFAIQFLWMHAIALVRLSIATSLMPLSENKLWKGTLYVLFTGQVLLHIGWLVILFGNCRPLKSFWEPTADMQCWDTKYTLNYGWASASYFTLMDLIMALMPIQLIRTLNRPGSEKILVGFLMGLGLLTTVTAAAKMSTFPNVYKGDALQGQVVSSLLAKLEEQVGIICACLPTLKAPAQQLLIKIGVISGNFGQHFSRPSFVMSMRDRSANAPADPEAQRGGHPDPDFVSASDIECANGSKLTMHSESGVQDSSAPSSERTIAGKDSKGSLQHSVKEVR